MKKEPEKKNKKMKKGKTISMILTIVILILLAGSMVRISKAGIIGYDWFDLYIQWVEENKDKIEMPGLFNSEDPAVEQYIEWLKKKNDETSPILNSNDLKTEDLIAEYIELLGGKNQEVYTEEEDVSIPEFNPEEIITELNVDLVGEGKAGVGLVIEGPVSIESKSETIKDAAGNEVVIETEVKEEIPISPDAESAKTPHLKVPSDEINDAVGKEIGGVEIFNNQIKFEGNTLTYTTKDVNGNLIDVAIVYNEYGTKESTTKKYGNNIIYFEEGKEKIEINHNLGIKTIDYDYEGGAYIATLADGSKGKLEDGKKFVYDTDEGVTHTLEALDGGGTLEFYNKDIEEGGEGTITITRGNIKIKFYGTFDGEEIKEKGKKILAIDENGNILTDFNKNDEAQTIYYAYNVFSAYVFGRKQSDNSEKIYLPGYKPFAFITSDGEVILIRRQEDNSYKYYTYHEGKWIELKEGDSNFKEVNAMVRKTKIGPAFYAAARAARGGIALSNLLNSWLDIDFITNWRKESDEFFSETVIGRIISGKWEESVCHSKIEKIPENIAVVNINNVMGFAAHVEGERSSAITTNNETLYFYKITFGVNPSNVGDVTFKLLIDDRAVDLDNDGMADKIKLKSDETYSGTGENAIVRYKPEIYEEVCLKFYNTENLNAEFRNALKDNKLCNKINEVDLSSVEISEPASSTTVSSTSTGLPGW